MFSRQLPHDVLVHLSEQARHLCDLTLELQDGTRFAARVERRAPVVDPLTGTVKFTIRASSFPVGAVPGAFVRAELLIDRRVDAPSIPRTAIFELEGVPHVYVVEDGRALMGQTVHVPMPEGAVAARVVSPVFHDPEGKRLHG